MTQEKPERTENDKAELSANWSTPVKIPESEPDIPKNDLVPAIAEQAHTSGWKCDYYYFGKLEGQGTDFFNPSLVMREDGIWMLTRASGLHPQGFMYGQNSIVAFKMEDEGKRPTVGKILYWPVENSAQHFEDPRGFYHPRLQQTMIGCCTFLWNGPGNWTGALQAFGAFDNDWICKKMEYPLIGGNPGKVEKILPKHYEKNWVWWLHEEKLHLLYKADPWTVHVFKNRWSERTDYKLKGITWPYGEIRGGTSPVQVADLFFTFHHSSLPWKGRYRRYYAGAIGFETVPPFKPRLITSEPLLQGSQNDVWAQRKPLVVFPCGALYFGNRWLVSMGVNDMKSAWMELSHDSLLSRMRPIEDVTGQIFMASPPHKTKEELTLERRRAALVKARAARAAKRSLNGGDGSGESGGKLGFVAVSKPKKRRRRYKRIKPERQREALRQYEKTLAKEEVKA